MAEIKVFGYTDKLSVKPGDKIDFHVSADGTTATFTQADHGFEFGDRIVVTGSESGTDAAVYNNNHTIVDVANSSSYTVTFGSNPTDNSESGLTVRRIVESRQLDGQLKESSLTRAEVEIVIRAFVTVWRRMRHRRIPYPIPSNIK